jgi:hypothetical protein
VVSTYVASACNVVFTGGFSTWLTAMGYQAHLNTGGAERGAPGFVPGARRGRSSPRGAARLRARAFPPLPCTAQPHPRPRPPLHPPPPPASHRVRAQGAARHSLYSADLLHRHPRHHLAAQAHHPRLAAALPQRHRHRRHAQLVLLAGARPSPAAAPAARTGGGGGGRTRARALSSRLAPTCPASPRPQRSAARSRRCARSACCCGPRAAPSSLSCSSGSGRAPTTVGAGGVGGGAVLGEAERSLAGSCRAPADAASPLCPCPSWPTPAGCGFGTWPTFGFAAFKWTFFFDWNQSYM